MLILSCLLAAQLTKAPVRLRDLPRVDIHCAKVPIRTALSELALKIDWRYTVYPEVEGEVSLNMQDATPHAVLHEISRQTGVGFWEAEYNLEGRPFVTFAVSPPNWGSQKEGSAPEPSLNALGPCTVSAKLKNPEDFVTKGRTLVGTLGLLLEAVALAGYPARFVGKERDGIMILLPTEALGSGSKKTGTPRSFFSLETLLSRPLQGLGHGLDAILPLQSDTAEYPRTRTILIRASEQYKPGFVPSSLPGSELNDRITDHRVWSTTPTIKVYVYETLPCKRDEECSPRYPEDPGMTAKEHLEDAGFKGLFKL